MSTSGATNNAMHMHVPEMGEANQLRHGQTRATTNIGYVTWDASTNFTEAT